MNLVKNNSVSYNLIITEKVENKIRYMCNRFPHNEWCGILFTSYKGTFEEKNLEIICEDLLLMDIGSHTFTSFNEDATIISYMTDNDLLDCDEMLIHSHCDFNTFFSETDTNTLLQEGTNKNIFVSLIVNDAGKYTAAITRHIKEKATIHKVFSYDFFKGIKYDNMHNEVQEETEYIEYFNLNIIKPKSLSNNKLDERIKEIQRNKELSKQKEEKLREAKDKEFIYSEKLSSKSGSFNEGTLFPIMNKNDKNTNTIVNKTTNLQEDDTMYINEKLNNFSFNTNILTSVLKRIITCSLLIPNEEKIDLEKWIKNCPKLYEKFFGRLTNGRNDEFIDWMNTYIDYLLNSTIDDSLTYQGLGYDEQTCILARDLTDYLYEHDENEWIDMIIDIISQYINL